MGAGEGQRGREGGRERGRERERGRQREGDREEEGERWCKGANPYENLQPISPALPPPSPPSPLPLPPHRAHCPQLIKQKGFLRTQQSLEPPGFSAALTPTLALGSRPPLTPRMSLLLSKSSSHFRARYSGPPQPSVTTHTPTDTHFLSTSARP